MERAPASIEGDISGVDGTIRDRRDQITAGKMTLVTLDTEMAEKAKEIVKVRPPEKMT